jgi:FixJ family two-component response regulator
MLARKLVHVVDDITNSSRESVGCWLEADPYEAVSLILDIHLGRVSGLEFHDQLSQSGVSTSVVFMYADDSDQTRRAALDAGCSAFLQKPFSGTMLIEAVQRAADPPQR